MHQIFKHYFFAHLLSKKLQEHACISRRLEQLGEFFSFLFLDFDLFSHF